MIERTLRGSVSDKTGSQSMSISNITIQSNSMIIVVVGYEDDHGEPVINWGTGYYIPKSQGITGGGMSLVIYARPGVGGGTEDLTIQWGGATYPSYKAAIVLELTEVNVFGSRLFSDLGTTTDPDTGESTLPGSNDLGIISFTLAKGPNTDNLGTIQGGYTDGVSIGTDNATEADNVFLHEFYKILTEGAEKPRAYKTGATSRYHLAATIAFRRGKWFRIGITPSDIVEAYVQFAMNGLDISKHAFFFNQDTDTWEIRSDVDYSGSTLVARSIPDEGWINEL